MASSFYRLDNDFDFEPSDSLLTYKPRIKLDKEVDNPFSKLFEAQQNCNGECNDGECEICWRQIFKWHQEGEKSSSDSLLTLGLTDAFEINVSGGLPKHFIDANVHEDIQAGYIYGKPERRTSSGILNEVQKFTRNSVEDKNRRRNRARSEGAWEDRCNFNDRTSCNWRINNDSNETRYSYNSQGRFHTASNPNPYNGRRFSRRYEELLNTRKRLPVWEYKSQFMKTLNENKIVLIVGGTGCGKTTQIPQWCVEYNYNQQHRKIVACTQPRRLAAVSVAKRVAAEMDVDLGVHVGYKIRFENVTTRQTILNYTSDGMLLRMMMYDTLLNNHSIIIIDEAHEGSVETDLLMGFLKSLIQKRHDLKVVIMSATLNVEKLRNYFDNPPVINIPGQMYPVEISYESNSTGHYEGISIDKVFQIHSEETLEGDILVFLTGQEEIEYTCRHIASKVTGMGRNVGELRCIPLYAALPLGEQQKAFDVAPPNRSNGAISRKVIVATNIAETSLTIDGVVFVVDCGYSKQKHYKAGERLEFFQINEICKSSADQRAGRAGRTKPGKCFRMYSEEMYEEMEEYRTADMLRENLAFVTLILKAMGVDDVANFDFIDRPLPAALNDGSDMLKEINALDGDGKLTNFGSKMAIFPLDPLESRMLLLSCEQGSWEDILSIIAMMAARQKLFLSSNSLLEEEAFHEYGDLLKQWNVYQAFVNNGEDEDWCYENMVNYSSLTYISEVRDQLSTLLDQTQVTKCYKYCNHDDRVDNIRKTIASAYFMNIAYRKEEEKNIYIHKDTGKKMQISGASILYKIKPEWVVYAECLGTAKNKRAMRLVTTIKPEWIQNE